MRTGRLAPVGLTAWVIRARYTGASLGYPPSGPPGLCFGDEENARTRIKTSAPIRSPRACRRGYRTDLGAIAATIALLVRKFPSAALGRAQDRRRLSRVAALKHDARRIARRASCRLPLGYIMPMSSVGGTGDAVFFGGRSAMSVSVERTIVATLPAFCSAARTTFVGSTTPTSVRSAICPSAPL